MEKKEAKDRALFNKIAFKYSQKDFDIVASRARKFQLFSLINECLNLTQQNKIPSVIELGCGIGASAYYMNGVYLSYLGVDYSESFIKIAEDNFANESVRFICRNIKTMHLDDEDVDFVFGIGVLHHVDSLQDVLKNLKGLGNENTIFGFLEPQASNPVIQLMRKIRMHIDKDYSAEQTFFTRKQIMDAFESEGYKIIRVRYQGYFTPPFAQVILKPAFLFQPILAVCIKIDAFMQRYLNNFLSWNILWLAKKE